MSIKKAASNIIIIVWATLFVLFSIFHRDFAKLHIQMPFLKFPVFIGEIVLSISFLLFVIFYRDYLFKKKPVAYLLYAYFGFILLKVCWGFYIWGPLAFRNAAMFYYVLFAILAYFVFPKLNSNHKMLNIIAIMLILLGVTLKYIMPYFLIYYLAFLLLLIISFGNEKITPVVSIVIFALVSFYILSTSVRALLVSYIVSVIFFTICFILFYLVSLKSRILFAVSVIGVAGLFLVAKSDKNSILSLIPISKYYNVYKEKRENTLEILKTMNRKVFDLKIYEMEKDVEAQTKLINGERINYYVYESKKKESKVRNIDKGISTVTEKRLPLPIPVMPERKSGFIGEAENNLLWRMFVITDMLEEVAVSRRVFGMDFGKPFRSKTVEALGWADGAWVGWIEPHNSFVHDIYRTGVLGIAFIAVIIIVFIRILIAFIRLKNIQGLILMSVILYWLLMANFMVVLELPYFAIPFWIFVGATFKYYDELKSDESSCINTY